MPNYKSIFITIASLATATILGVFVLLYKLAKLAVKNLWD